MKTRALQLKPRWVALMVLIPPKETVLAEYVTGPHAWHDFPLFLFMLRQAILYRDLASQLASPPR